MTHLEAVPFLASAPTIDGIPDDIVAAYPRRAFDHVTKMDAANPDYDIGYRIAYGADFLYLHVEVTAESYTIRDRGYQNGDGLVLILATPQPDDEPTEAFVYLAFWPKEDPVEPAGKMVWGKNGSYPFSPLDTAAFAVQPYEGKVGFELCLPWEAIPPYHPWLNDAIGFDLYFTKAIGDDQATVYTAVLDDLDKVSQTRAHYGVLPFEPPTAGDTQTYVQIARSGFAGMPLDITAVTLAREPGQERLVVDLDAGEGSRISGVELTAEVSAGLTVRRDQVPTDDAIAGGYRVRWRSAAHRSHGSVGVSLLPPVDVRHLTTRLENVQPTLSVGSQATLHFRLARIADQLAVLDATETCAQLRFDLARFLDVIQRAEAGEDALASQTGLVRRAFVSDLDGSLQPYTVYVPEPYCREDFCPAVVHLHGSDSDDTSLQHHVHYAAPPGWFQIAPFGRGTANAFTHDDAQTDIREAIADACRAYPIDPKRIVLAGFSMGGYGVYRTQYEAPGSFAGLAVFSGVPDLAERYFPGAGHPNFLSEAPLACFRDIPMFVFHGVKDHNAPFSRTEEVVTKLRAAGARVEFAVEENSGHSPPGEATTTRYHQWLIALVSAIEETDLCC